ncbi:ABC transporter substrate-binding protein [Laceyella sacchari]|uniref:Peptide/nickel transport system substrate-binding protein n=1 Tax=Laceyella tengchongensis TaxID=574699 RepID=A0AA45WII9_9BACL|nr:ABC transporter substrate-binding protein [Laceyella tengchongensis]AUS07887.1 ABC transporter substrate-binding protein [Laceyella sacchari]SMP00536.1 peptide/nickel transport system substrate-binding protein [Laceyella tengchongensis]
MKKRLWLVSLIAIFIFSSVLVGCVEKKSAGTGKNDKTLIYGRGEDAKLLDPSLVTDGESTKVTDQIFDNLVEYADGSTDVVPSLAESWEASEDAKVWTFKLRKDVKFHDGTPFNAEAVVFNFERWADKNHPQHKGGDFPYYAYMFGGYKGDPGHKIKSVTAVDEFTVKFELTSPQAPFLQNLAMSAFGIASPTAVKKDPIAFTRNPVGTGPFKLKEWKKNDTITLVKNGSFWRKGEPKLDKVIFKVIPDNSARFTALKSGDVDIIDGLNPTDVAPAEKDSKLQVFKQVGMNVGYLAFNTEKKPFDNPKVRQAFNHAVNKEALIKNFYSGLAKPAINPMPEFMLGYNKDVKDYEFNLDKAKQLLAEAGYADGMEVEFFAMTAPRPYMPDGKKIAEYIQADLAKIGVKAKIVTHDWQIYLDKTGKGEHQMALFGWNGDNGDPDNFLYVLLDKDNTRMPDAANIALYKNDELHDLLIRAQELSDEKQRAELYMKAQEIIKRDAPWVPIAHATVPYAAKKEVIGFKTHPTTELSLEKVDFAQ